MSQFDDEREVSKHLEQISHTLDGDVQDWKDRADAMEKFRKIISDTNLEPNKLSELCRPLREPLTSQLQDLRSAIVKEACQCVAQFAEKLGSHFSPFAESFIEACLKLTVVTIKVMSTSGATCIKRIIQSTRNGFPRGLSQLLRAMKEKSNLLRRSAIKYLTIALQHWKPASLMRKQGEIESVVLLLLRDADSPTRASARGCFTVYRALFPDRAAGMFAKLDLATQKLISGTKPVLPLNVATQSPIPSESYGSPSSQDDEGDITPSSSVNEVPCRIDHVQATFHSRVVSQNRTNTGNAENSEPNINTNQNAKNPKKQSLTRMGSTSGSPNTVENSTIPSAIHQNMPKEKHATIKYDSNSNGTVPKHTSATFDQTITSEYAGTTTQVVQSQSTIYARDVTSYKVTEKPLRVLKNAETISEPTPATRARLTQQFDVAEPVSRATRILHNQQVNVAEPLSRAARILHNQQVDVAEPHGAARIITRNGTNRNRSNAPERVAVVNPRPPVVSESVHGGSSNTNRNLVFQRTGYMRNVAAPPEEVTTKDLLREETIPRNLPSANLLKHQLKEASSGLNDSVWSTRIATLITLRQQLVEAEETDIARYSTKIQKLLAKAVDDVHYKVVAEALETSHSLFRAHHGILLDDLETLLPSTVTRIQDPKLAVKKKAQEFVTLLRTCYTGDDLSVKVAKSCVLKANRINVGGLQTLKVLIPQSPRFSASEQTIASVLNEVVSVGKETKIVPLRKACISLVVALSKSSPVHFINSSMKLTPKARSALVQLLAKSEPELSMAVQEGKATQLSTTDSCGKSEDAPVVEQSEVEKSPKPRNIQTIVKPDEGATTTPIQRNTINATRDENCSRPASQPASPPPPLTLDSPPPNKDQVFSRLKLGNSNERYLSLKVIQRNLAMNSNDSAETQEWLSKVLLALVNSLDDIQVINSALACKQLCFMITRYTAIVEKQFDICFHTLVRNLAEYTFREGLEVTLRSALTELLSTCNRELAEKALLSLMLQEKEKRLALSLEFTTVFIRNSTPEQVMKTFPCFYSSLCKALESSLTQIRREAVLCFATAREIVGPNFEVFLNNKAISAGTRNLISVYRDTVKQS